MELILFIHSFTYISMCAYRTCVWARVCVPLCMLVEAGAQLCEGGSHLPSYVGSSDWIQVIRLCSEHLLSTELSQEIFIMEATFVCVCIYICARTRVGIYGGQRSEDNLRCPSLRAVHLSQTRLSRVWSLPRWLGWLANESQRIYWLSRPSLEHDILPNFLRGFRDEI